MDLEERQAVAAGVTFVVLGIGGPLLFGLGALFVTGWLMFLGVHDVHEVVWGWLSTKSLDDRGRTVWGISSGVATYYLGVTTAYIAYQISELFYGGFKVFRRALT